MKESCRQHPPSTICLGERFCQVLREGKERVQDKMDALNPESDKETKFWRDLLKR